MSSKTRCGGGYLWNRQRRRKCPPAGSIHKPAADVTSPNVSNGMNTRDKSPLRAQAHPPFCKGGRGVKLRADSRGRIATFSTCSPPFPKGNRTLQPSAPSFGKGGRGWIFEFPVFPRAKRGGKAGGGCSRCVAALGLKLPPFPKERVKLTR